MEKIFGQNSHLLGTEQVRAAVTALGGHLAPVSFTMGRRQVQPFAVAPWWSEKVQAETPALLRVLRGDFFCAPFGGGTWRGETHPPHGETANSRWQLESRSATELHLSMQTTVRAGRVDKWVRLVPCQMMIYQEHRLSGMRGPMCLGHHATLKFHSEGRLSTSPRLLGQVAPEPVEQPTERGYSILQPGAVFDDLAKVPMITGQNADLSRYPARRGFEDIAILVADPRLALAWTAVTFPAEGYVWFSLRDPKRLVSTLLWMSNGGRHYPPWNGRHVDTLGLEDLTAFFHYGLGRSARPNSLNARGVPTTVELSPKQPLTIKYAMGVVPIPKGFDQVQQIEASDGQAVLTSRSGKRVTTPIRLDLVR